MRSTPCWFLMGLTAAALAGCATMAPPPRVARAEVAVLVTGQSDDVIIRLIDRSPPQGLATTHQYELAPGKHTLNLIWGEIEGNLGFFAEAGHTYYLRRTIDRRERRVMVSADDAGVMPDNRTLAEASALNSECAFGKVSDCLKLGMLYERGSDATGWDEHRAAELYEKACGNGVPLGCNHLGDLYQQGHGVEKDVDHAMQLFRRACEDHEGRGCNNLGIVYAEGRGVIQDDHAASRWYQKGCNHGYATACYNLGSSYLSGAGVEKDRGVAFDLFEKACKGGEASGCYKLALLTEEQSAGPGSREIMALHEKGCEGGEPRSCVSLGLLYEDGVSVGQDERRAATLYEKACATGAAMGCAHLGVLYQLGLGVNQDTGRAAKLLEKACRGGEISACVGLAAVKKANHPPARAQGHARSR